MSLFSHMEIQEQVKLTTKHLNSYSTPQPLTPTPLNHSPHTNTNTQPTSRPIIGKTHTMQGSQTEPGIIPRAVEQILNHAQQINSFAQVKLTISYVEIYNEKVYDLFQPKEQDLPVRETVNRTIVIQNLSEIPISNMDDFRKTYQNGCRNRTTAATKLNSSSSRSHAILLVRVTSKSDPTDSNKIFHGKLHLIDLAGSEDNRRTGNRGERLVESSNINQSLFVLGKVVNALSKQEQRVPYRDSKLTRILQDSLGGNSHSILIANVAGSSKYFLDTYNTLNFAAKSKLVINKPIANVVEIPVPVEIVAPIEESKKRKASGDDQSQESFKRPKTASEIEKVSVRERKKKVCFA